MPELRTAYNYDYVNPGTPSLEPSLTEQHHKDACDINLIMRKYQRTGMIDHVSEYAGHYGLLDGQTFQEKQQAVAQAISMFEDLPSSARDYFDNDPAKFLDFAVTIDDETDRSVLVSAGLLEPDPYHPPTAMAAAREEDPRPSNAASEPPSPDNPEGLPE